MGAVNDSKLISQGPVDDSKLEINLTKNEHGVDQVLLIKLKKNFGNTKRMNNLLRCLK